MAEYIKRAAIVGEITSANMQAELRQMTGSEAYAQILSVINCAPAADVAPVVHGRWVGLEYDGYADGLPVYDLWECSECGNEVRGEDVPDTHQWCNGCGARMDGDDHA